MEKDRRKVVIGKERLEAMQKKVGERIKFMLRNNGELDHEFVLATTQENLEHAEMMKENPQTRGASLQSKRPSSPGNSPRKAPSNSLA